MIEKSHFVNEYVLQSKNPIPSERIADNIRVSRIALCFPVVNRGSLWYESLTGEQRAELAAWYQAWLDAPGTGVVPGSPDWLR